MDQPDIEIWKPDLHDGQKIVARSPARFRLLAAGRRWGKTRLAVLEALKVGLDGGRAWWVAPSYPMAREGWRPLAKLAATVPAARVNRTDRTVTFSNGGMVEVRSTDDPDSLRGAGLDFVVLDECAFMRQEVGESGKAICMAWEVLRPALADREGRALFISTPKGVGNWFTDLYETAEHLDGWERWQFRSIDNPHINPAEIEAARLEIGSLMSSQEFDAEFVQHGGAMFKAEWARYYRPRVKDGLLWFDTGEELVDYRTCERFATVDLAASVKETADYTVILSAAVHQGRLFVIDVQRRRLEGPDIVPAIRDSLEQHDLGVVHIEKAGFQLSLIQAARRDGLPVKELTPDRDKRARALPLQARMEAGDVWFPKDADWLGELQRELWAFPASLHDDQVDALAYAANVMGRRRGRVELPASLGEALKSKSILQP